MFEGESLVVIRGFPEVVRRRCGYEIDRLQRDLEPKHWKPFSIVGQGVSEIKIRLDRQYRVVYAPRGNSMLHILHAFIKKTRKIPTADIGTAQRRLKAVIRREEQ